MPKKAKKKNVVSKAGGSTASKTKATKKAGSRGKRYTSAEKTNILNYIDEVNAKKGRGGAAAASRKFKISQITLSHWVKKAGKTTAVKKTSVKAPAKSVAKGAVKSVAKKGRPQTAKKTQSTGFAGKLRRLADVHEQISKVEAQLSALQKEYASLKKEL